MKQTIHIYYVSISMAFVFIVACNSVNETVDLRIFSTATSISAGEDHTCAVLSGGTVKCWGYGSYGQLGDGSTTSTQSTPVSVSSISTATSISAGSSHTCAMQSGGKVRCWGGNSYGQLGQDHNNNLGDDPGEITTLADISLKMEAVVVDTGAFHSCAILKDGAIQCWGNNTYGQLGLGHKDHQGDDSGEMAALKTVDLGSNAKAVALSLGEYHSCALLETGQVKCWGRGDKGQLALNNMENVGDGMGKCERDFLCSGRTGFTNMVTADRDWMPFW